MVEPTNDHRRDLNWLARLAPRYALVVGVIHLGLVAYGIFVHGPGWDEYGHLPAAMSHLATGNFDLYRVNPPLVRMVAAIPLIGQEPGIPWEWNPKYDLSRPEFKLGTRMCEVLGPRLLRLLRLHP